MLGARPSETDSEMGTKYERVDLNPPPTHSVFLDASTAPSLLVAASPTEGEMDSSATLVIADETTGELENSGIFGECDTTPEHLRNGIAVGVSDTVANANEDLPQVIFVIPGATLENAFSTHCTPSNADGRNDTLSEVADIITMCDTVTCRSAGTTDSPCAGATELVVNSPERRDPKIGSTILELLAGNATLPIERAGTCMTMKNADESGDPTAKLHVDGSSERRSEVQLLGPAGITTELKNLPSLDSITGREDGPGGARAEVPDGNSTAPQVESTDCVYDFDNTVAVGATNEGRLEVRLIVSSENTNALKNPRSTDNTAEFADGPTDARSRRDPPAHDECTAYLEEITENELDFNSVVPVVYQTAPDHGALLYLVPNGIQTSVERGDDELEGDHNEVVVSAPTEADSEAVHLLFQNLEGIPTPHMTACASGKEKCLGDIGVLDTGSQAIGGESEVIGKEGCKLKFDDPVLGVASMCSPGADLKHGEDVGSLSIVCTIPEGDHDAIRDRRQRQATGSPTEDVSIPRSGQLKLLNHGSCVAIKKAINIGLFRKRRREEDQLVTNPKRVCQNGPKQRVDLSSFPTDRFMQEPLSSSVPSTPANTEKRTSVMESIVKPEPVTYEPENRTLVMDNSIHEPLWVLALPRIREGKSVAAVENIPLTGEYLFASSAVLFSLSSTILNYHIIACFSIIVFQAIFSSHQISSART